MAATATERPRSAAANARATANATPASSLGMSDVGYNGLADVLTVVQNRKSDLQSHNIRIGTGGDDDGAMAGGGQGASSAEATAKERDFLWKVFQAFDQDGSGAISALEVRALFDRVALEESYAARGQLAPGAGSGKMFKAAAKFITQLFDDDLDGKLSRSEMDRFFAVFGSENDKLVSWDEFFSHASILMGDIKQREADQEEAKQHVPSREELKALTADKVAEREREVRKAERMKSRSVLEPAARKPKGGVPSMLNRQASAPTVGGAAPSSKPDKASGQRSRAARPEFA